MKSRAPTPGGSCPWSPLTEGRGLKFGDLAQLEIQLVSPLTEGRGLKLLAHVPALLLGESPLTEGRGLKCDDARLRIAHEGRPSRRGVD